MTTIWIISQYASTPNTGVGGRNWYLARELASRGHRVYLIAARWHHLLGNADASRAAPFIETLNGVRFVRIPTSRYAHAHDRKRVLNWVSFAWRLKDLDREIRDHPDAILCSSPSLFSFLGAEWLARKLGSRLIFEVRDIWPLTLTDVGGYSQKHPLIRLMQWIEDRAYRIADSVVSNLPGAVEHMVSRGMDRRKFHWIPNGFSKAEVDNSVPVDEKVLAQIPSDKFIVGYAGTLGLANALDNLIGAAELLSDRNDILFVLVGGGREKNRLKAKAESLNIRNIIFVDPVSKSSIHSIISMFDVCFIGWNRSPLYQFGISANKLFDYFYSGRPVIHSFSGSYDLVRKYDAGFTVEANNPTLLAHAILQLRALPNDELRRMGENGRQAALAHHEYGILATQLEQLLLV